MKKYLCAAITLVAAFSLFGQFTAHAAGDFQVNAPTPTDDERDPAIAAIPTAAGGYVTAFFSGQGGGIFAQRLDSAGVRVGQRLEVDPTSSFERSPKVAVFRDGTFAVVWYANTVPQDVYAQFFKANGGKLGSRVTISNSLHDAPFFAQLDVAVIQRAQVALDELVVTWTIQTADTNTQNSNTNVYARRLKKTGALIGATPIVVSNAARDQTNPRVTSLVNGSFVVCYAARNPTGDRSTYYVQRFTAAGLKTGAPILVNSAKTGVDICDIEGLPGNDFFVTWLDLTPGMTAIVRGQRYTVNGAKKFAQLTLNTAPIYAPSLAITSTKNGTVVVAWSTPTPPNNASDVIGQRVAPTGAKSGANFKLNSRVQPAFDQTSVDLTRGPSNTGFAGVWDFSTNQNNYDINGRIFPQ